MPTVALMELQRQCSQSKRKGFAELHREANHTPKETRSAAAHRRWQIRSFRKTFAKKVLATLPRAVTVLAFASRL